ncbi:MAG: choice-of-anchor H family protein [Gammaproteobacteria bacterium]|nr:choice-of-anchor H family protein [Gammaproteobacteria bacterium]MDH5734504.1 choice-of-anchor H family protein [Gammaproteobacteria bacterium]
MLQSIQSINLKKLSPVLLLGILVIPSAGFALENLTSRSNKTISYQLSIEPDQTIKDRELKDSGVVTNEKLIYEGFRQESTVVGITATYINYTNEFSIFNASSNLISDFDYDGFYHRFRVTVDADTIYQSAHVYAKLYLSYEGGPWNYYACSSTYHINGDSSLDSFTIETELTDGYPAGYYDIRIELYDADYDTYLLAYGPYDNTSLSTLPLEDSYRDANGYGHHSIETDVFISGSGSMDWLMLTIASLLLAGRKLGF